MKNGSLCKTPFICLSAHVLNNLCCC